MHGSKFLISYSSENQIDMFDSVLSKKKEQLLSIRENLHSQPTQIQKLVYNLHIYIWFGLDWLGLWRFDISVISWRLVVLVEETGVPGENHRPVPSP